LPEGIFGRIWEKIKKEKTSKVFKTLEVFTFSPAPNYFSPLLMIRESFRILPR